MSNGDNIQKKVQKKFLTDHFRLVLGIVYFQQTPQTRKVIALHIIKSQVMAWIVDCRIIKLIQFQTLSASTVLQTAASQKIMCSGKSSGHPLFSIDRYLNFDVELGSNIVANAHHPLVIIPTLSTRQRVLSELRCLVIKTTKTPAPSLSILLLLLLLLLLFVRPDSTCSNNDLCCC